jgi:putative intracellular protease/amidase
VKRVLIAIPERDFDPTESGVPWQVLTRAGHDVVFATPSGKPGRADPSMLTGEGLDIWGWIPAFRNIVVVGLFLRANRDGRLAYEAMIENAHFKNPLRYDELRSGDFDALVLPGGHYARGVTHYLESWTLQRFVADFFDAGKPVGAICHGALLAARSFSLRTNCSVLYGKQTTSLTWSLESLSALVGNIVRFWEPNYYRTYVDLAGELHGYRSVQAEITRALANPADFLDVPKNAPNYWMKTNPLFRDSITDDRPAWVVESGNYVSARWAGDAHTFARRLLKYI